MLLGALSFRRACILLVFVAPLLAPGAARAQIQGNVSDIPGTPLSDGLITGLSVPRLLQGLLGNQLSPQDVTVLRQAFKGLLFPTDQGDFQAIGPPGAEGFGGTALGGSPDPDDFWVVGTSDSGGDSPFRAFRLSPDDQYLDLGRLGDGPNDISVASEVSDDGSVVVGLASLNDGTITHAFRWTAATGMVDLEGPGGADFSQAIGVSGDGTIIVGQRQFDEGERGFVWTEADGFRALPGLQPFAQTFARAVSSGGGVIIGESQEVGHAVRWTPNGAGGFDVQDLGVLDGHTVSAATGLSDSGAVIVGASTTFIISRNTLGARADVATDFSRAFRWTEATGMADLNQLLIDAGVDLTGITLQSATAISPDGSLIATLATTPTTEAGASDALVVCYVDAAVPGGSCTTTDTGGEEPVGGGGGGGGGTGGVTTAASQQGSVDDAADAQIAPLFHLSGSAGELLGSGRPTDAGDFVAGFGAVGSFTAGGYGRYSFGDGFTLFGGLAYTEQDYGATDVDHAFLAAGGLRYMFDAAADLSPFVEAGGWAAPELDLRIERTYANGAGTGVGRGRTDGYALGAYGRTGVVGRPSRDIELVFAGTLSGSWLELDGYAESTGAANPFPAIFGDASSSTVAVSGSAAMTTYMAFDTALTLASAIGHTIDVSGDANAVVGPFAAEPDDYLFCEASLRLAWRPNDALELGASARLTSAERLGTHAQGGVDVTIRF